MQFHLYSHNLKPETADGSRTARIAPDLASKGPEHGKPHRRAARPFPAESRACLRSQTPSFKNASEMMWEEACLGHQFMWWPSETGTH